MNASLKSSITEFAEKNKFKGKGPLCVALVVTQHAKDKGLPLDDRKLLTAGGGQVLNLGVSAVQKILSRHGIQKVLAKEGGRTSRGSINNMRCYVEFLNTLYQNQSADLELIEGFWIEKVLSHFAGKPFKITLDKAKSLRQVIRLIINQAIERQKDNQGTHYSGAVLQHLVGAKLDCALGIGEIEHHSFSTADGPRGRTGDFELSDVCIHVTTSPGEAVIERCNENIEAGFRPILITTQKGLSAAEVHAESQNLDERIDIFEIEQFIALNLYEIGRFTSNGRSIAIDKLVERYNEIIEKVETDPSLKIEIR